MDFKRILNGQNMISFTKKNILSDRFQKFIDTHKIFCNEHFKNYNFDPVIELLNIFAFLIFSIAEKCVFIFKKTGKKFNQMEKILLGVRRGKIGKVALPSKLDAH